VKLVEHFPGNDSLGDGTLRVSLYLEPPQHVRLSIWKGEAAEAALSLDPWEADRLVSFLQSHRVTKMRRVEAALQHSLRALADALFDPIGRTGAASPPPVRGHPPRT
jgi:hypothetical protein